MSRPAQPRPDQALYAQLRRRSLRKLWEEEIPRFDQGSSPERLQTVALIRAVGVVFSETGTADQKDQARTWLRGLLHDPEEKIRRYAMTALPKLDAVAVDEAALLSLLDTAGERERKFLGRTLEKIGGAATLAAWPAQRVHANVARQQTPGAIRCDTPLQNPGLAIHLHCRRGLEEILRAEIAAQPKFTVTQVEPGLVVATASAPFTLAEIYAVRCFSTLGFRLGEAENDHALAPVIASDLTRKILRTFTAGPIRYRLEFPERGHQRGAVRALASAIYACAPELLNDPRQALWTVAIHRPLIELSPRLRPDPRFTYRRDDVPAASHPSVAAALARLSGPGSAETIWDPFCGSGLELIERARLGHVRHVYGTDLVPGAVAIARANFDSAQLPNVHADFYAADFRDFARLANLKPGALSLILTNPPFGKRVPMADLAGLIADLFHAAAALLRPGGRLVLLNPVRLDSPRHELKLVSRQLVDLGGVEGWLEVHRRA